MIQKTGTLIAIYGAGYYMGNVQGSLKFFIYMAISFIIFELIISLLVKIYTKWRKTQPQS